MLGKEFLESISHRTLRCLDLRRSYYSRHGWIFAPARETTLMFNHILVALDGSDCSHKALGMAVQLAKEQGARCTVCTVVDIVSAATSMTFATGDVVNEWIATLNEDARQIESEAMARYANSGVTLETRVLEGYPSSALIDVAKNTGADLIVMGSHGRTGLKRLWLGSVAESVVREATIPVLIVR
ncbi:MAG TPA: universal stress protein [Candidatus Cybelea sp.]|jgi:nucleotide-binding universal stress UspA family protein|nr:universal stress protein [Candidatus Cybelea sp.]